MLTSAGFGSTAARARFLGHRLCEAQRVALLLAEHDCFGLCSGIASTFEKCFFSRLVQGHQCSFQRLVPILIVALPSAYHELRPVSNGAVPITASSAQAGNRLFGGGHAWERMLGDRRTDKAFGTKQVLWASSLQQLASSASTVCSFGHTVLVGPAGTDFNIDGIAKGGKAARGRCSSSAATAADVDSLTPERGWVSVQVDSSPSFLNAPLYA